MEKYLDSEGHSGVRAFETGSDFIDVQFTNDGLYRYSYHKPGPIHVEVMKRLAHKGQGLATYISKHVRTNYEEKLK